MVRVPLYNRSGEVVAFTVIDPEDAPLVNQYRWYREVRPDTDIVYAVRRFKNGDSLDRLTVHNLVLGVEGIVDHIDGDGLDNRKVNLRPATHAQNMQNRKKHRNGGSQHRGVWWDSRRQRWIAQARLDGKKFYLGSFADEDEAGRVAAKWRAENMPYAVDRAA